MNCPQVNGDQLWLVATYRKNRGKGGSSSTEGNASSVVTKQIKALDSKHGKQKLIGTKPSNGDSSKTSLKSDIQIISKNVVHIDYLGPDCTEALLQDYLLAHTFLLSHAIRPSPGSAVMKEIM